MLSLAVAATAHGASAGGHPFPRLRPDARPASPCSLAQAQVSQAQAPRSLVELASVPFDPDTSATGGYHGLLTAAAELCKTARGGDAVAQATVVSAADFNGALNPNAPAYKAPRS